MSLFDTHLAAFNQTKAILGDACPVFTWKNREWKCIPNRVVLNSSLRQGGFVYDSDTALVLHVDRGQFEGTEPQLNHEISYLGRGYTIDSKEILPGALIIEYRCFDKSRAAGG